MAVSEIDFVSIIAAVTSLVGMGFTIFFSQRRLKSSKVLLDLQHFNATSALNDKVHDWAKECVCTLSEAILLSELDPKRAINYFEMRNKHRANLSALIDQGRWYFENDRTSGYGSWKRWANQGIAPEILELLKKALRDNIDKLNYRKRDDNQEHRGELVDIKKAFTDKVQQYLEPDKTHNYLDEIGKEII
jgi:hypothetical protein